VFQTVGNGYEDTESEEDDSYWNQYDQFTATTAGLEPEADSLDRTDGRTEITPRLEEPASYYDQYDNIETAISSGGGGARDFAQPAANESVAPPELPGMVGSTKNRSLDEIGMEDYIRTAVRNLSQLALRSGMSDRRLRQLITEGLN
jgi:hypothetical protein